MVISKETIDALREEAEWLQVIGCHYASSLQSEGQKLTVRQEAAVIKDIQETIREIRRIAEHLHNLVVK